MMRVGPQFAHGDAPSLPMNKDTKMLRLCIASELHRGIGEEGLVKRREGERKQCGDLEVVVRSASNFVETDL